MIMVCGILARVLILRWEEGVLIGRPGVRFS